MSKLDHLEVTVQRVISEIIQNEVKADLGFITVTGVHLTKDLSFCNVYYTVLGNAEKREKTKNNLEKAKPFIRTLLCQKVQMRKAPELSFRYDETLDRVSNIEKLIKETKN